MQAYVAAFEPPGQEVANLGDYGVSGAVTLCEPVYKRSSLHDGEHHKHRKQHAADY